MPAPQFAALNGTDVIDAKVSPSHPVEDAANGILSWNLGPRYKNHQNPGGANNPFDISETSEEGHYKERLEKHAKVIAEILEKGGNENISKVMLQSVPADPVFRKYFIEKLTEHLPDRMHVSEDLFLQTNGTGQLVIYDTEKYDHSVDLSNYANKLKALKDNTQIVALKKKGNEELVAIANVCMDEIPEDALEDAEQDLLNLAGIGITVGGALGEKAQTLTDKVKEKDGVRAANLTANNNMTWQWDDQANEMKKEAAKKLDALIVSDKEFKDENLKEIVGYGVEGILVSDEKWAELYKDIQTRNNGWETKTDTGETSPSSYIIYKGDEENPDAVINVERTGNSVRYTFPESNPPEKETIQVAMKELKEADVDPIRIFGSDPDYGVKAYKAYKELYQNPPPDIAFSPTMKEVIQASEEHRSEVPELARQGLGMQNN